MTRPIQETNDQRQIQRLGYTKRQLERRPAPDSEAAGRPIWAKISRTQDITMVSGNLVEAFPDDNNNATLISQAAAGEIDVLPYTTGGNDFLGVFVFEPGVISCSYKWAISGLPAALTILRSNINKQILAANSPVGIQRYEYVENINTFLVVISVVDNFIVTQTDIDDSIGSNDNYFAPRARQESGINRNLNASEFDVWWQPIDPPAS